MADAMQLFILNLFVHTCVSDENVLFQGLFCLESPHLEIPVFHHTFILEIRWLFAQGGYLQ